MSTDFERQLSVTLVTAYRSILKIEDQFLKRVGTPNVSTSEMHLLEGIHRAGARGRTVKELGNDLGITQPSVSAAVNRLEKKGCVERRRSQEDGRVVYIHLTARGTQAYALFSKFHSELVEAVTRDLDNEEKQHLLKGMLRLNRFFEEQNAALARLPQSAEPPADFVK